jgi:NADP-dependent alcohol dehydrogenase
MENFTFHNPVRIVFGKGAIGELADLLPAEAKVLMIYGGGSVKANGVYEQVAAALAGRQWREFGGIEPNPRYATCMRAVELVRREGAEFLLAVGGGSVLDATKFVAVASIYPAGRDPWEIMLTVNAVGAAMPLGCVMTLPATGSEMNGNAVVTRDSTQEKLFFKSTKVLPLFSILDPATTFSLPARQTANGVIDAFVHVLEQYLTYPAGAPLQDRQAEAILQTLIEEGPKALADPENYDARANVMWCATNALNGLIGCGVPKDFASHRIGHELTALYGVDHGRTLAIMVPAVLKHFRRQKRGKLIQYAERVWGAGEGDEDARVDLAIARTEDFFRSLGVGTRLEDHGIGGEAIARVADRLEHREMKLSEQFDLSRADIEAILALASQ